MVIFLLFLEKNNRQSIQFHIDNNDLQGCLINVFDTHFIRAKKGQNNCKGDESYNGEK